MRRARILEILYHPAFISLLIWIVLLLTLPVSFSRYRIKILDEELHSPFTYNLFSDLDYDGSSERISLDICDPEQTKVIVYKDDKVIDQYNVAYHPSNIRSVSFFDYNGDSHEEIYIFTINDTALFLNVIDPLAPGKVPVSSRMIDRWKKTSRSNDRPYFLPVGMSESKGRQGKDLIFCVTTGFSLQPRNIYRYIIDSDSLIRSPRSYATIDNCLMISRDGVSEEDSFLLSTQATGNADSTVSYSDLSAWLMVLTTDLDFAFEPVEIGSYPSRLVAIPLKTREPGRYLVMLDYFGSGDHRSAFYVYDEAGNRMSEHETGEYEHAFGYVYSCEADGNRSFYFLRDHSAAVEQMNGDFNIIATYILPPLADSKPIAFFDADMDGTRDYFFIGRGIKSLVISREDFRSAIDLQLDFEGTNFLISQLLDPEKGALVYIQNEKNSWLIRYERHPLFYFRIPLYAVFYLVILLFITLIYRIQKYRVEMKRATEREIASLQMKAIRNQIEPHFTLNVLNAIGGLYLTEENRQQANYIFGRYASLIRQTVISSDRIIIPLEDELEFLSNYIDIERFRAGNSFEYSVNIAPGIDTAMRIPRMLVFTFAENSVKHGLRRRTTGGVLEIRVGLDVGHVVVTVKDNGPGLVRDDTPPAGMGKGLKIVSELNDLFYRLEKIRITYSIEDLNSKSPAETGTIATINIPLRSS